jgi:hypothetical protein
MRRIVRPVGVVDHFVQHHPRIRRQAEDGAVDEGDAERRIRSGGDHVAFFDVVTIVKNDRNTVADRGRGAGELGHMADDLARARIAAGLRILNLTGKRIDEIPGEMGAIGRCQRRMFLALEVIVQNEFAAVAGENEINTCALELTAKQQLSVGNNNGIRRNVGGVNRFYVGLPAQMRAEAFRGPPGVNFSRVIQRLPNT